MNVEDMPLFARLLAQYGIDPRTIPTKATFELVEAPERGVVIDTLVFYPEGSRRLLVDAHEQTVTYRKFYPEPKEPR